MTAITKACSKCDEEKPLDDFYPNANGVHGRMPYCKDCDNARTRTPSPSKINRNRARHRAVADLIARHEVEFNDLYQARIAEATEEADVIAASPAAVAHQGAGPARLRTGKPRQGQTAVDRVDVARCPHCVRHHDRGHRCVSCGSQPQVAVPTPIRPHRVGINPPLLQAFNAGTARPAAGDRGAAQ